MMKPYVLTWLPWLDGGPIDRQKILDVLNTMPEVLNWRAAVGAIFIISESSPTQLSIGLRTRIPNLHHMIVPIDVTIADGWADKETWDFIQHSQRVASGLGMVRPPTLQGR
jgi:hypothetical protein